MNPAPAEVPVEYVEGVAKSKCEESHLWFTRYFFNKRQGVKFRVNWHHVYMADLIDQVIAGEIENLVVNVAPGGTKTETFVINFIARGLALNPRARFLHLSGSETLAGLNSSTAREIVTSADFQNKWPLKIADDTNSKKRWNVLVDGFEGGGVYATSTGGQVTGFRAGRMVDGFQGAILLDDPIKPEDAYSRTKVDAANRKILTTIKSRKANPATPIVVVMQRVGDNDPTAFIKKGNVEGKWTFVQIPAVITEDYINTLPEKYQAMIERGPQIDGRFSYWPYKERIEDLLKMERGDGVDQNGARVSRHVFASQYQQEPKTLGGNIIKGADFIRYQNLPKLKWRKVFADTAQKTKERNDFSVFEEWGLGDDGKIYLIALERGRWEAPELQKRAIAFWARAKGRDSSKFGQCRKMVVEDKSSGTGLVQTLSKHPYNIPIEGKERDKDKLTRCMDALPWIESGHVCIPADAPFTTDFVSEAESFSGDDTHDFDDQLDPMFDATEDMLQLDKTKQWVALGQQDKKEDVAPAITPSVNRILVAAGRSGLMKSLGDRLEPKKPPEQKPTSELI